jgi:hypothetical protein
MSYVDATPEELDSAYDYLMNEIDGLATDLAATREAASAGFVYAAATYDALVRTQDQLELLVLFFATMCLTLMCMYRRRRSVEPPTVVVAAPVAEVEAVKEDAVPV